MLRRSGVAHTNHEVTAIINLSKYKTSKIALDKSFFQLIQAFETIFVPVAFNTFQKFREIVFAPVLIWSFHFITVPLGPIPELPADSCKEIKASEGREQAVNGSYWLDLEKNGDPLNLYCDMTTDGGK